MIVDLPAPVEPTIATFSPGLTEKFIPFKTSSFSVYEKNKFFISIEPLIFNFSVLPFLIFLFSFSIILKTLFAATIPICKVLNLSAICLKG